MRAKLKRFMAILLATSCIFSTAVPASAASESPSQVNPSQNEDVQSTPTSTPLEEVVLDNIPKEPSIEAKMVETSESELFKDPNTIQMELSGAERENLLNENAKAMEQGLPVKPFASSSPRIATGAAQNRVTDNTPDDVVPKQPSVTPVAGKAVGQIVQEHYTHIGDLGTTTSGNILLVIGIVDNRPKSERNAPITIDILRDGQVVSQTAVLEKSADVYWGYAEVKTGLYTGVNTFTARLTGTSVVANTAPYVIDGSPLADIGLYPSTKFTYKEATGPEVNPSLRLDLELEITTVAKAPIEGVVYCDDEVVFIFAVPTSLPGKYTQMFEIPRLFNIPKGDRTLKVVLNEDRNEFEINSTNNSYSQVLTIPSDRRPYLASKVTGNSFVGTTAAPITLPLHIVNKGSDSIVGKLNFVSGGDTIHSVDLNIRGQDTDSPNIEIPFSAVNPKLKFYKSGSMSPLGYAVTLDCYGIEVDVRLGSGTDMTDGPVTPTSPQSIKMFFYYVLDNDSSMTLTSTSSKIVPDAMNNFRVRVKNNNSQGDQTVTFKLVTTGFASCDAYVSQPITVEAGSFKETEVQIYCQNAPGLNTVTAQLIEPDFDNTNNLSTVSYSVDTPSGGISSAEDIKLDANSILQGMPLNVTSVFRVNVTNPDPLPSTLKVTVDWYLNGRVHDTETRQISTGTPYVFKHSYGSSTGTAYAHISYYNQLVGKNVEMDTSSVTLGGSRSMMRLSMDSDNIFNLQTTSEDVEDDSENDTQSQSGVDTDEAIAKSSKNVRSSNTPSGSVLEEESAAPYSIEPRASDGLTAKATIKFTLDGKVVGTTNATLKLGTNKFYFDYDSPSWSGSNDTTHTIGAYMTYTNPGTGESTRHEWRSSTFTKGECLYFCDCTYEYNLSSWGSAPSGGSGGGGTSSRDNTMSFTFNQRQPAQIPTVFPNSTITWYVDGNKVHSQKTDFHADQDVKFPATLDTSSWGAGDHKIWSELNCNYVYDGQAVILTSDKVNIKVHASNSISVKDLKPINHSTTFRSSETMEFEFTIDNRTNKEYSNMRYTVYVPGTDFKYVGSFRAQKSGETRGVFTMNSRGLANGKPYQLMGDIDLFVNINLDDNGTAIYADDSIYDNVTSRKIKIEDAQPVDVAIENVKMLTSFPTYGSGRSPMFYMNILNYSSAPRTVELIGTSSISGVVHRSTLNLRAGSINNNGQIKAGGYGMEIPIIISGNGTHNIVWEIKPIGFSESSGASANNTSGTFKAIVDTFNDVSVSIPRVVPASGGTEYDTIDLYFMIKNVGDLTFPDATVSFKVGNAIEGSGGFATVARPIGLKLNKEYKMRIQEEITPSRPEGTSLFFDFGKKIPVTVLLRELGPGDSDPTNNSATAYVDNEALTDVYLLPDATHVKDATLTDPSVPGSNMTTFEDDFVCYLPFRASAYDPGRVLFKPNAVLRLTIVGHPEFYPLTAKTGPLGEFPFLNELSRTSSTDSWESSQSGKYSGYTPIRYDGVARTVTVRVTVDPGEGEVIGNSNCAGFYDPNMSNNTMEFKVKLPEFPNPKDLVTQIHPDVMQEYYIGGPLDFTVSWADRYHSTGKGSALREIYLNGTQVWTSRETFPYKGTSYFHKMSFTYDEMVAAGVDLTQPFINIQSYINKDKAIREYVTDDDQFFGREYENNMGRMDMPITHSSSTDFVVSKVETSQNLVNPGDKIQVKASYINNSSDYVVDDKGDLVDVNVTLKLNNVEIGTTVLKGFGGLKSTSSIFDVTIPQSAAGPQNIEVAINPKRTIKEDNFGNNTGFAIVTCKIPASSVDMGIFANPVNYSETVGNAVSVRFEASMAKNKPNPFSDYNTIADIYIGETKHTTVPVTWNNEGKAVITVSMPASVTGTAGYQNITAMIDSASVYPDINPVNDTTVAGVTMRKAAAPDDFYVTGVSIKQDSPTTFKVAGSFVNLAKLASPQLLCEYEIYNYSTNSWQIIMSEQVNIEAGAGVNLSLTFGAHSTIIGPTGDIKIRGHINRDKRYPETDLTNNMMEASIRTVRDIDISADWIKAVPMSEYTKLQDMVDTNTPFTEVKQVRPNDQVFLIAKYSNAGALFPSAEGVAELISTSTAGKPANVIAGDSILGSIGPGASTYLGFVVNFPDEDTVKIQTNAVVPQDSNATNNSASTSLVVKQAYIKNITADSIKIINNTTGIDDLVIAGDNITIKYAISTDMFDFPSVDWRIIARDQHGASWEILSNRDNPDKSFIHNSIYEFSLTIPKWNNYTLEGDITFALEVDYNDTLNETNETDNTATTQATYYNTFDMQLTHLPYKSDLELNQSLDVYLTTTSIGIAENTPVDIDIYSDDVLIGTYQVNTMGSGELHIVLPAIVKGDHTLKAVLNPERILPTGNTRTTTETTYANNTVELPYTVSGDPDIIAPPVWRVTNQTNPSKIVFDNIPANPERAAMDNIQYKLVAMSTSLPIVLRYRITNDAIENPQHWDYLYYGDGSAPNESFSTFLISHLVVNPWYYGNMEMIVEVNPSMTKKEQNDLNSSRAGLGLPPLKFLPNGRMYEEVDYTNNTTVGTYEVRENPDYQISGLSYRESGNLPSLPPSESVIQNSTHAVVSRIDVKGTSILHSVLGIPVNFHITSPSGKESLTLYTADKKYVPQFDAEGFPIGADETIPRITSVLPTTEVGTYKVEVWVNEGFTRPEDVPLRGNNVYYYEYNVTPDPTTVNFKAISLKPTSDLYAGIPPTFEATVMQTGNMTYRGDVQWFLGKDAGLGSWYVYQTGFTNVDSDVFTINNLKWPDSFDVGNKLDAVFVINPSVSVPPNSLGTGIDPAKKVIETDYNDNSAYASLEFKAEPLDIIAKSLEVLGNPASGETITLRATTTNSSKLTDLTDTLYDVYFNDTKIYSDTEDMPPKQDTVTEFEVKLPPFTGEGKFEIRWNMDSQYAETSYLNNTAACTKEILQPQLDLVAVSAKPTKELYKLGEEILLDVKFKNSSTGVKFPKAIESINYIITDGNGAQMYRDSIPRLEIDEVFEDTATIFVPLDAVFGDNSVTIEINPSSLGSSDFKDEIRFDNNTCIATYKVDPPRNLQVLDGIVVQNPISEGDTATVTATLTNKDPTTAYTPQVEILVDGVRQSIQSVTIPADGSIPFSKVIPDLELGDHKLGIVINPSEPIPEDTFEDNTWIGDIQVRQGKDFATEIKLAKNVINVDSTFPLTVTFTNNFNKPASAPYYIQYRGNTIKTGTLDFTAKQSKDVSIQVPAGSLTGMYDIEAGINIDRMASEEYDTGNNIAFSTIRVRDHNVDGKVDATPLDPDDPVDIEIPIDKDTIDNTVKADDPTSIIDKIIYPDGTEERPGENDAELNWPILPGEEVIIKVVITTDDGELSREYEIIFRRPKDDVDATAYLTASDGTRYEGVRTDTTFTISLPSSVEAGTLYLEATEDDSYISEVDSKSTSDKIFPITDLLPLFTDREMTVDFTAKSGSGTKTKDFVVKLTIGNTPPTIRIVNASELDGSVFNRDYGRLTGGTIFQYGPGITGVSEAIGSGKTRGMVIQVEGVDMDPNQYIFAEVKFLGRKYPITWLSYSGSRTTQSKAETFGYAFIPAADLSDTTTRPEELRAYVFDTLQNIVGPYLSQGQSDAMLIELDNQGPDFDVDCTEDIKTVIVKNIRDNIVGPFELTIKAKPTTVASWGTIRKENVETTTQVEFVYDELSRKINTEVTVSDKLMNKTRKVSEFELPSTGDSIVIEGAYASNSRKAMSVFINVRYRDSADVDLLGFGFLGG